MNPEATQKLIEAIEKNGGAALDALAAYQAASAYGDLVVTIIAPFALCVLVYFFVQFHRGFEKASYDAENRYMVGMIGTVVVGTIVAIVTVATLLYLPNTIAAIKNPKGAAIHDLFKTH